MLLLDAEAVALRLEKTFSDRALLAELNTVLKRDPTSPQRRIRAFVHMNAHLKAANYYQTSQYGQLGMGAAPTLRKDPAIARIMTRAQKEENQKYVECAHLGSTPPPPP